MTDRHVMLGDVPIRLHAGPPTQSYAPRGDGVIRYRSKGRPVKFRQHDLRWSITVAGSGWMGPGLAGLDFDQPLELRCTAPQSLYTTSLTTTIPGTPRPDKAPWAHAYVAGNWVDTPLAWDGTTATITSVAGATEYHVRWLPMFMVLMGRPEDGLDPAGGIFTWHFTAEEI